MLLISDMLASIMSPARELNTSLQDSSTDGVNFSLGSKSSYVPMRQSPMIGNIFGVTPYLTCFTPSSYIISVNSSMSGPSMPNAESSICIMYDAWFRKRLDLSSSGDLTSMPMGYPNKTFVSGQTSKRLFIEIRDQNECDDESLSPYSKLLNY